MSWCQRLVGRRARRQFYLITLFCLVGTATARPVARCPLPHEAPVTCLALVCVSHFPTSSSFCHRISSPLPIPQRYIFLISSINRRPRRPLASPRFVLVGHQRVFRLTVLLNRSVSSLRESFLVNEFKVTAKQTSEKFSEKSGSKDPNDVIFFRLSKFTYKSFR